MISVNPLTRTTRLHGRDRELLTVRRLLDAARSGSGGGLLVTGPSGMGRTALLECAEEGAHDLAVLSAHAAPGEGRLPLAGLHQLLLPALPLLPRLPRAQRETLARALDTGDPGEALPLANAVLGLCAEAASERPLLFRVDDVHLLDAPSREAVAFVARRLTHEGAAVLLSARDADPDRLTGIPVLRLRPLEAGAVLDLVAEAARDGCPEGLADPVAAALAEAAQGNPRAALELLEGTDPEQRSGAAALEQPPRSRGELTDAFTRALARIDPASRLALVRLAADPRAPAAPVLGTDPSNAGAHADAASGAGAGSDRSGPRRDAADTGGAARSDPPHTVTGGMDPGGDTPADPDPRAPCAPDPWAAARDAGLVSDPGRATAFTHPLARSAAYHRASPAQRRSAHLDLARAYAAAGDTGRAVWHRALAEGVPDERVAAALHEEAHRAVDRDGHAPASLLHEHAARFTPDPALRGLRLTDAARSAWLSGDPARARRVLARVRPVPPARPVSGDAFPHRDRDTRVRDVQDRADLLRAEMDLRSGVAIDAFAHLGPAADRLARSDPGAALRVLLQAGEASCLSGDHERFFATARRARDLAEGATAPREADTRDGPRGADRPWDRLVLDYMTGKAAMFQGRHGEGAALLERAVETADRIGDPQALVLGGIAGLLRGDHLRTRALAGRAVAVARRTGAYTLVPQALEFLTYAEMWFGRLSLAQGSAAEGLRVSLESGQDNCASHHRGALAFVAAIRGDEDACREHAGTALALAGEHDVGLPAGLAAWALALLDLGSGRTAEAAMRLRTLARSGPGSGHAAVRLLITPHLVEASVRGGVAVRVDGAVETFASWAEATGQDTARAQVMRCRGLLGAGAEADRYFERALDLHASGYCDFEEARTRLLYGGHLRRSRHPGRAREHLRAAVEVFDRLDARPWARQAREELRAARGSTAARTGGGTGTGAVGGVDLLSPQQMRIARHVAEGATNREVAARLFLSTRTVDHHLRNIYSRLGIRSRVELARLVGG
ncbi:LuxR family transcriptional regulator [Nocardiopsis sp. NPDC007018]|uniref:helix-turn-helix transcriptional regulator n=1 Tax=Nocardiopsis sp. NPDC007018 TaxID=3155721 RepID=UPI0033DF82AE